MNGEDIARELGEIRTEIRHLATAMEALDTHNNKSMDDIHARLDEHIREEGDRLKKIDDQLSIARFVLMAVKFGLSALLLILTLRFGDIAALWKNFHK